MKKIKIIGFFILITLSFSVRVCYSARSQAATVASENVMFNNTTPQNSNSLIGYSNINAIIPTMGNILTNPILGPSNFIPNLSGIGMNIPQVPTIAGSGNLLTNPILGTPNVVPNGLGGGMNIPQVPTITGSGNLLTNPILGTPNVVPNGLGGGMNIPQMPILSATLGFNPTMTRYGAPINNGRIGAPILNYSGQTTMLGNPNPLIANNISPIAQSMFDPFIQGINLTNRSLVNGQGLLQGAGLGMSPYNYPTNSLMTQPVASQINSLNNNPYAINQNINSATIPYGMTSNIQVPYTFPQATQTSPTQGMNIPYSTNVNAANMTSTSSLFNNIPNNSTPSYMSINPLIETGSNYNANTNTIADFNPPALDNQQQNQNDIRVNAENSQNPSLAPWLPTPPLLNQSEQSEQIELAVGNSIASRTMNVNLNQIIHNNELLVVFRPGISIDPQIHDKFGSKLISVSPYAGFHRVSIAPGSDINQQIQKYKEDPSVLFVEPNYLRHSHLFVNDPYYPYQWHLNSIFAGWAWDIGSGSGAIVALLDSGVAYRTSGIYGQAPDLAGTLFAPGYDFINLDAFPDDDNSHGTHMAGCIAQTTNNLIGVAGVAFSATIMPVKIMDSLGNVTIADEVNGIYFAANNGAHIINMSLGGLGTSVTEEAAVDYAYNNGVTLLASAGNRASSTLEYPGSYASCISISAIQYDDTIAPYSNYGTAVDFCSPGGNLNLDQNFDGWADGILQQRHDGVDFTVFKYYFEEGTSPACAIASGVVACIVGKSTVALSPLEVTNILQASAIDIGAVGWDQYYGWGKVNAYYALINTPP